MHGMGYTFIDKFTCILMWVNTRTVVLSNIYMDGIIIPYTLLSRHRWIKCNRQVCILDDPLFNILMAHFHFRMFFSEWQDKIKYRGSSKIGRLHVYSQRALSLFDVPTISSFWITPNSLKQGIGFMVTVSGQFCIKYSPVIKILLFITKKKDPNFISKTGDWLALHGNFFRSVLYKILPGNKIITVYY